MHDCFAIELTGECVWSVSFDWREACRPSWCNIGSTMGAYPRDTGSNPVEGNGHFFPSYRQLYLSSFFDTLHPTRGCCVPPKRGGGGGRKRAVSPQCEVRLKMATAEPTWGRPNHRKSYAMLCGWATWGRFLCFLRGSGRFGSTVTYISGSTGYLTSETN